MFKFECNKNNVLVVVIKDQGVTIREWMGDAWSDRPIYLPMNIVWAMCAELTRIHKRFKNNRDDMMSPNWKTQKLYHHNSGTMYNPDRQQCQPIKFGEFSLYLNAKSGEDTRKDEKIGMIHARKYNRTTKEGHFFNVFFEDIPIFVDWLYGTLKVKAVAVANSTVDYRKML